MSASHGAVGSATVGPCKAYEMRVVGGPHSGETARPRAVGVCRLLAWWTGQGDFGRRQREAAFEEMAQAGGMPDGIRCVFDGRPPCPCYHP